MSCLCGEIHTATPHGPIFFGRGSVAFLSSSAIPLMQGFLVWFLRCGGVFLGVGD